MVCQTTLNLPVFFQAVLRFLFSTYHKASYGLREISHALYNFAFLSILFTFLVQFCGFYLA